MSAARIHEAERKAAELEKTLETLRHEAQEALHAAARAEERTSWVLWAAVLLGGGLAVIGVKWAVSRRKR